MVLKENKKVRRIPSIDNLGSFKIYIKEINEFKILKKEEEEDLAKQMAKGNMEARDKLILSNLRFVVSIAKRYINKGVPFLDLINEGNMGLILACDKFDYRKGYRFISYAVWWIKQYIAKSFAEQLGLIRLPMNKALQYFKIRLIIEKKLKDNINMNQEDLLEEVYKNIEKRFNLKRRDIIAIMNAMFKYKSLNDLVQKGDKRSIFFEDLLIDVKNKLPESDLIEKDIKKELYEFLSILTIKERKILFYRYGLEKHQTLSLGKIGNLFSVSKERIRQIEKGAIKKLHNIMSDKGFSGIFS